MKIIIFGITGLIGNALKTYLEKYSDLKSPPSKTDYHPIGACYETIEAMKFYKYWRLVFNS